MGTDFFIRGFPVESGTRMDIEDDLKSLAATKFFIPSVPPVVQRPSVSPVVQRNLNQSSSSAEANSMHENDENENGSDESLHYHLWDDPKSPPNVLPPSFSAEADAGNSPKITAELALYKLAVTTNRPTRDLCVFSWWKQHEFNFPQLAELARAFLSVPATSVCSERLFSKAGLIYGNTLRNRLKAKTVENILIAKANMDKNILKTVDEQTDDEMTDEDD